MKEDMADTFLLKFRGEINEIFYKTLGISIN
jgi:hypothetical protein